MRFLSAPWTGLLTNEIWLENARHANRMAKVLSERLHELAGVHIMFPVEANAVFVRFPDEMATELRERGWQFYDFVGAGGSRLMCSWDTGKEDVQRFVDDCRELTRKNDE